MKSKFFLISCLFLLVICLQSCQKESEIDEFSASITEQTDVLSNSKRSCGHTDHVKGLMQDPAYERQHQAKFDRLKVELSKAEFRSCDNPVIIPIAVHFQGVNGTSAACLRQLVESQIDALNKDFTGTNADINKWTGQASAFFQNIANGEACLKFCVATQNHPAGFGLADGAYAITVNRTNGTQLSDWSGYLNVFVQPDLGFLGESPLGGLGDGDGVMIDAGAFGIGTGCGNVRPQAPYNMGRTLTHEVGHYLLLDHIWGDGCAVDDGVNDTPEQDFDYGGCPELGLSTCGSNDLHMNYMDYTNDACMYMFSSGQTQRMVAYVNSSLTAVTANAGRVCGEASGAGDTTDTGDGNGPDEDGRCERITTSTSTVISASMVQIDWSDVADAVRYRVRYREQGTTRWTGKNVTTSAFTIAGLDENTIYQYQIRVQCPQGWVPFSPASTFVTDAAADGGDQSGAECDGAAISLSLILDDYGSETSWELTDDFGDRIDIGGPFEDGAAGQEITVDFCLPDGCYILYIDDAYGDGICCDYGDGSVTLANAAGTVIGASDGFFGEYSYIDFCIENGRSRFGRERKGPKKKSLARKKKA